MQQDVLLIYGDGYDVTGKQLFFLFLAQLLSQHLVRDNQRLFAVEYGDSVIVETELPRFAVYLHQIRHDTLFQLGAFPVEDVPLLVGVFIERLSGVAYLQAMVDDGKAVLVMSLQVLPPLDADAILLQLGDIFRIIGTFLVKKGGYTFF